MNDLEAVKLAFPKIDDNVAEIIAKWYKDEDAQDDFADIQLYSAYIVDDIWDMLDACCETEQLQIVYNELKRKGYAG